MDEQRDARSKYSSVNTRRPLRKKWARLSRPGGGMEVVVEVIVVIVVVIVVVGVVVIKKK